MTKQREARWYLYELIDPRNGEVFYVGKGTGPRLLAHEREALKDCKSRKTRRIREIWASDAEVERRHVAFFWDEQAAYDAETDRIEEIGLDCLTNVMAGGQVAWERRRVERKKRSAPVKIKTPLELLLSMPGRLAFWLIKSNGGKDKVWAEFSGDKFAAFRNSISKAVWLHFMPNAFKIATETDEGRKKIAAAVLPYGIQLEFA
jgi:hypothetical protein